MQISLLAASNCILSAMNKEASGAIEIILTPVLCKARTFLLKKKCAHNIV